MKFLGFMFLLVMCGFLTVAGAIELVLWLVGIGAVFCFGLSIYGRIRYN